MPEADLKRVRWWLNCGDEDFLNAANAQLHQDLLSRRIAQKYRVRDRAHTRTYWRTGLPDALKFIALSLHRYLFFDCCTLAFTIGRSCNRLSG